MLFRDKFQLGEWRTLCESPFVLSSLLTNGASQSVVAGCEAIVKGETQKLSLFPPSVRVVFLSIKDYNFDYIKQKPPEINGLSKTFEILRLRADEAEIAAFQMSLAMIARTVLKFYGREIANSVHENKSGKSPVLMAQVWELLEIGNANSTLRVGAMPPNESQFLQLGLMHAWLYMSLLDSKISDAESNLMRNLRRASFPPLLWEIIPQTVANLDALYRAAQAENNSLQTALGEISALAENKFSVSNAVFYKMSLLMLARDVAETNALNVSNTTVPGLTQSDFAAISTIADALNLNDPFATNAENATTILPSNNNTVMTTPENTALETKPENVVTEQVTVDSNVTFDSIETVQAQSEQHAEIAPAEILNQMPNAEPDAYSDNTNADDISNDAVVQNDITQQFAPIDFVTETVETADAMPVVQPISIQIDEAKIERELSGTLPTSLGTFSDYKKTVNIVAADLRDLMDTANELKMQNSAALLNEMLKRVEENSFSIAVVGEFKRGKSTFINALIGKDILPSDILPCSATLNRVTYGVKPDVLIRFKDGREDHVDINQLQDYVTKLTDESEEMAGKVKEAVVSYPLPYCQNNVEIIDTPGLNDDAAMTDVTLGVLPHVDAAVLVIMAQSPFSEYERAFLEDKLLTSDLGRVLFLVTAIDRLNRPEDADRVVKAIKDRIRKYVIKRAAEQFGADSEEYEVYLKKIGEPRVFPVSAWQALQAKEKADANLMTASRFGDFENALEKFLSEERGSIFLQVPINRLLSASSEILSSFKIREGALQMRQTDFNAAHEKTFKEIEVLRQRKNAEMQRLDQAARQVEMEVKPLIGQLDETFKAAATDILDTAEISNEDVANQAAMTKLVERLNAQIQSAVQSATQKQLEKIQLVVQRGVTAEAMRWTDFSDEMNVMSKTIEGRFGIGNLEMQDTTVTQGVGIVATLFGFGGAYTGYKVAGWKGAGAGAVASIGVGLGTLIAIGLVAGTFLALPVLIIGTLAALPAGGWLTRKMFGDEGVKKFREQFKKTVLENLEQQLSAQSVEQKIIAEVDKAFNELKDKIHLEVESTLNDTEKTLEELRAKRGRDEILSGTELQQLTKMKRETVKIRKRAAKLNDLLLTVNN